MWGAAPGKLSVPVRDRLPGHGGGFVQHGHPESAGKEGAPEREGHIQSAGCKRSCAPESEVRHDPGLRLFHVFSDEDRDAYVSSLESVLAPDGTIYMLCFSEKEPPGWGPRRITATRSALHSAGTGRSITSARPLSTPTSWIAPSTPGSYPSAERRGERRLLLSSTILRCPAHRWFQPRCRTWQLPSYCSVYDNEHHGRCNPFPGLRVRQRFC